MDLTKKIQRDWKACAKLNLLLCFAPLPFAIHAYLFGFSECAFVPFVVVFEVGMLLHTAFCVDVGYASSLQFNLTSTTDELRYPTNRGNMSVLLGSISVMCLAMLLASLASRDFIRAYGEPTTVDGLQNHTHVASDSFVVQVVPGIECPETLHRDVLDESYGHVHNHEPSTLMG
jgi:hypothetical protein